MLLGGGLSVVALLFLFQKHISGQPLLRYEPRRRVPWGGWAATIVVFFLVQRLLTSLLLLGEEQPVAVPLDPAEFVRNGWITIGLSLLITVMGLGALAAFCHADRRDLGLPDSWEQFLTDTRIGFVACLAALAPVYLIQLALQFVIQPKSHHPLLDQLQQTPTPQVLLTALGAAVLAAPLFEEFAFRLLLQGALERFEDQQLHYSATKRTVPITGVEESLHSEATEAETQSAEPPPAKGLLPGLPHGWAPVLASGLLFALAHVGHGADPVPLLLLGTVFGYLYQRTHRIVPCIVAHMLFNAYSLSLAWLQLGGG